MKSYKIDENESSVCVTVEVNKRKWVKDPVETVNMEIIKDLLNKSGHDPSTMSLRSGPFHLTNYVPKGIEDPTLSASWVFEKKNVKKPKKNEIKVEASTSNESTTVKSKRTRRTKKLS